jgi:hypothetical protein
VSACRTGHLHALEAFGLEKSAIDWGSIGNTVKTIAIGEPTRAWNELQAGKLMGPGGMLREALWPSHPNKWVQGAFRTMAVAGPAMGLYAAMNAPQQHRGEAMGDTLGRTVGTTLGMPLGMVGSTIGGNVLAPLGRSIGRIFDSPTRSTHQRPTPNFDYSSHGML